MKPFICQFCDREFSESVKLSMHECTHTGKKHSNVNFVRMIFLKKWTLTRYEHTHTSKKPLKCNFCNVSEWYKVDISY